MKREHKQACVVGISRGLLAEACSRTATLLSAMQIFQARLHYMTIRSRRKMTILVPRQSGSPQLDMKFH